METLKKQTNIGGDVKETDKYSWDGDVKRNRQILVETLKKQTNTGGDVKETDKYWWRRNSKVKSLMKQTNISTNIGGGDVTLKKQTNIGGDVKETDKYWWRR